jgi:hypothetical protein
LLQAGVLNTWTDKSLGRLAELMPGRYAKNEISSGFLGEIDTYAYRLPVQNLGPALSDAEPAPPAEPIRTTRLDPQAKEVVDHEDPR